jgi:hypothetical protein
VEEPATFLAVSKRHVGIVPCLLAGRLALE